MTAAPIKVTFPSLAEIRAKDDSPGRTELDQLREQISAEAFKEGRVAGLEAARIEAAAIFQSAREDGFEAGHMAASEQIRQAASALLAAAAAIDELHATASGELEQFAVEFVLAAMQKLAVGKQPVSRGFVVHAARAACEELKPSAGVEVWLSPDDFKAARKELADLAVKASPEIAPGAFHVEGGALFVEGSLDEAIAQIGRKARERNAGSKSRRT